MQGLLILLLGFNWFWDYPDYSDPLIARSGVVEYFGAIKSDLIFHYTRTDSLETVSLPFYIRAVPLDNFRFGVKIPFVWLYPEKGGKRVGIGDIKFETTYQLFNIYGDFFSVGGEFSLPTTSDTLKPTEDRFTLTPFIANAYVWKFLALFFDFGVLVPVYDFKVRKFVIEPEESFYHLALQVWPIRLLAFGVEYENKPAAFIPHFSIYLSDTWDLSLGLILPMNSDSARMVIAGVRLRL